MIAGITSGNAFKGQPEMRDWPVLKVLSNCGLRHQAQDQAEGILKLQRIPGWSEQWHNQNINEKVQVRVSVRQISLLSCFQIEPGFELLKREAGSKLTQPGVSAAPTKHSLTISSQRKKANWPAAFRMPIRGEVVEEEEWKTLQWLDKDTVRGNLCS